MQQPTFYFATFYKRGLQKTEEKDITLEKGCIGIPELRVSVLVAPKYEGYFLVRSSINPSIDGKLLPYECLIQADGELKATKPYGSTKSVSYRISDFEEIKFMGGDELPRYTGSREYTNLKKIDLSEMYAITEIPRGFFYCAGHIEEVYAPSLPNLSYIGNDFMCYNEIKKLLFDFTNVTQISEGFLDYAFADNSIIEIDLSQLRWLQADNNWYSAGGGILINNESVTIYVKVGDFIQFDKDMFKTNRPEKGQVLYMGPDRYGTSKVVFYSHDAVALQVKLSGLDNISVIEY